jgi:DNA-binding transcriptional LysR family regulator
VDLSTIDLNKLRTFGAVVDAGGISAGARRLDRTRSAVSQSVSSLEESLGLKLFNRVGRRLVLTAEGRALAHRFRRVESLLSDTLDEIRNVEQQVRGLIRVGLFLGASSARLAAFLADFLATHSAVRVKLRYGSQAELQAGLAENRLDLAFSLQASRGRGSGLRSTRLYRQELVLVTAEGSPSGIATPAQLSGLDVIDYYQQSPLIRRWLRHHYGRRTPRPRVRGWAASAEMVLELVRKGAGAAVLPRYWVEPLLEDGSLAQLRGPRPPLRDTIWLTEAAGVWRSRGLDVFRAELLEAFGGEA